MGGRLNPAIEPISKPATPVAAPPEPPQAKSTGQSITPAPRELQPITSGLDLSGPLEPTGEPDLAMISRMPSAENVAGQLDLGLNNLEGKWRLVATQNSRLKTDVDGTKHISIAKGDEVRAEALRYDNSNKTHWVLKLSTPINGGVFYAFHQHWEVWNEQGTREGFAWRNPEHSWN